LNGSLKRFPFAAYYSHTAACYTDDNHGEYHSRSERYFHPKHFVPLTAALSSSPLSSHTPRREGQ